MLRRYQFSLARLITLVTLIAVLLRLAQSSGVECWPLVALLGTAAVVMVVIGTWQNIGDTMTTCFLTIIGGVFSGILGWPASTPLLAVVAIVGGSLAGTLVARIVQRLDRRISARMKHHAGRQGRAEPGHAQDN